MKSFYFLNILIVVTTLSCAMDQQKVDNSEPTIFFPSNQVVYIGACEMRKKLTVIFQQEFPLNTPFFNIELKNFKILKSVTEIRWCDIGEAIFKALPEYVPHQYIKNGTEGSILTLTLHGTPYNFRCSQKAAPCYRMLPFEKMLHMSYAKFLNKANCLPDGTASLLNEKVITIDKCGFIQHGKDCVNDAKENDELENDIELSLCDVV